MLRFFFLVCLFSDSVKILRILFVLLFIYLGWGGVVVTPGVDRLVEGMSLREGRFF
jgi:hypothetical protein